MNKILRNLLTHNRPKPLLKIKKNTNQFNNLLCSFGKKNKNKFYYVIKRTKGSGFFSNFFFVLNHIRVAENSGFIPVVDMKNFKTIYSEISGKYKNKNLWNLFFNNISNIKLENVYKSRNVIFSEDLFPADTIFFDWKKNNLKNIFNKFIKINRKLILKKKNL